MIRYFVLLLFITSCATVEQVKKVEDGLYHVYYGNTIRVTSKSNIYVGDKVSKIKTTRPIQPPSIIFTNVPIIPSPNIPINHQIALK